MNIFQERKERPYKSITEEGQLQHLIKNYLLGNTFFVKGEWRSIPVQIQNFQPPLTLKIRTVYPLNEGDILLIYKMFQKYMDASLEIVRQIGKDLFLADVREVRIALNEREHPRFELKEGEAHINNLRLSKNEIKASLFNIPTSVKVYFHQYENQIKGYADHVKIHVFGKEGDLLHLVKKHRKILLIPNIEKMEEYRPSNKEEFLDLQDFSFLELPKLKRELKEKKIHALMYVPILYVRHDGMEIPLGYFELISYSEDFPEELAMEMKQIAKELVEKIQGANTVLITKKQPILNVSHKGFRIRITDEELKKQILRQSGFICDIVFRLQQPITMFLEIIYTAESPDGDLILGCRIAGISTRKGESKLFHTIVEEIASSRQAPEEKKKKSIFR